MKKAIRIHETDNVSVALEELRAGTQMDEGGIKIKLLEDIPQGHKFALSTIKKGDAVIKYGMPIGEAAEDIVAGQWVHAHNLHTGLSGIEEYIYHPSRISYAEKDVAEERYFWGYRRRDGRVGVRNEIWVIPTVGCVSHVALAIARQASALAADGVDAVIAFPHPYGCSQMGQDQENTRKILAGLINHPNAAGVLVLGLGCENTNISEIKRCLGNWEEEKVRFLAAQECEDEIAEGVRILEGLAAQAKGYKRELISCGELIVGMKCGGSDGLSGITANPVVGKFSDLLAGHGGTTILTEVPEMFGAERLLMNRCRNEAVFRRTVEMVNGFKEYFIAHGQPVYENPSPGNKAGGISTLEDKSLGCIQKSGSSPVCGVLEYGEEARGKGLLLLNAPGNDLVASTALAASGAQIILFTTGRGTPFASPVPTVKLASNSGLFRTKGNWMDFDCGRLLEQETAEGLGRELFEYVIEVAEGRRVKTEKAGYHDMAIWKQGVTL